MCAGTDPSVKFQVTIGAPQRCTCQTASSSSPSVGTVCIHILFVMLKVMKTPPDSELLFKASLSSREVDAVLSFSQQQQPPQRQRHPRHPRVGTTAAAAAATAAAASGGRHGLHGPGGRGRGGVAPSPSASPPPSSSAPAVRPGHVPPKPVDAGDECPICFDDLSAMKPHELTWCALSCGKQLCMDCMGSCINHKKSENKQPKCPLCRGRWLDTLVPVGAANGDDGKGNDNTNNGPATADAPSSSNNTASSRQQHVDKSVKCSECKRLIVDRQYRCLHCRWFNLCKTCFREGASNHSRAAATKHHRFIWRPNDRMTEWNAPQNNQVSWCVKCTQLSTVRETAELGGWGEQRRSLRSSADSLARSCQSHSLTAMLRTAICETWCG